MADARVAASTAQAGFAVAEWGLRLSGMALYCMTMRGSWLCAIPLLIIVFCLQEKRHIIVFMRKISPQLEHLKDEPLSTTVVVAGRLCRRWCGHLRLATITEILCVMVVVVALAYNGATQHSVILTLFAIWAWLDLRELEDDIEGLAAFMPENLRLVQPPDDNGNADGK